MGGGGSLSGETCGRETAYLMRPGGGGETAYLVRLGGDSLPGVTWETGWGRGVSLGWRGGMCVCMCVCVCGGGGVRIRRANELTDIWMTLVTSVTRSHCPPDSNMQTWWPQW